jgi:hypothetical protein
VVHVYDLAARQRLLQPVLQLPCSDALSGRSSSGSSTATGAAVNVLSFNPHAPALLAAAVGAVVRVWRLPAAVAEPRAGEGKLLSRVLESEDVAALLRAQCIVSG